MQLEQYNFIFEKYSIVRPIDAYSDVRLLSLSKIAPEFDHQHLYCQQHVAFRLIAQFVGVRVNDTDVAANKTSNCPLPVI